MCNKKSLTLLLTAMLVTIAACQAQIRIPNTNVSFSFPNNDWKYLQTTPVDKNTNVYLYAYAGDYVIDNAGDTIIPFMRLYVRRNFEGSVYDLAYSRFMTQPFQSLDEYFDDIPGDEKIGYWGAYTNEQDGKDYEFYMNYFKDKTTVFEVRIETSRDNFEEFMPMFKEILKSFSIKK